MTIVMNMSGNVVDKKTNMETADKYEELRAGAILNSMPAMQQAEDHFKIVSRLLPISLATVDIESFLQNMPTRRR